MTVVDTPSGRVEGRLVATPLDIAADSPPIREFRGIRYAEPPVGARRFRPPVAAAPWTGTYDATAVPTRSVQPHSILAPAGDPEGEDCLFLNVWTPRRVEEPLPVMVWFHGGSFVTGSSAIVWYHGARLAGRRVVVVTVNYRLGALGFLDLAAIGGDEWAGSVNLGLQDQALALRWVQDHIAAFGGDPSRVTIFGESAGAMSVSCHLGRPGSVGGFRRAIAQSGAAGHVQSAESGERVARRSVELLGGLDGLRDLPVDAFRDLPPLIDAEDEDRDLPLPFRPTVDGVVLPVAPLDALAAGAAAGIDLLTGTNRDEMQLFRLIALLGGAPADLDDERFRRRITNALAKRGLDADPADVERRYRAVVAADATNADMWSAIGTDLTFRLPMVRMLDAHVAGGGRSWSYEFAHRSTGFGGALGAAHAVEIPFVFDNLLQQGTEMMLGEVDRRRLAFAADLADRWVAFAAADDPADVLTVPGTDEPWPAYEPEHRRQVILDLESSVVARHGDDRRALWGH